MMVAQRSVMAATWRRLSMACLIGLCAVALQAAELEPELLEVERDEPEQLESAPVLPEKTDEARTWLGRYVDRKAEAFANSDLVFTRSRSNAPFLPIAYAGGAVYDDATVRDFAQPGSSLDLQQSSASLAAGLPFLMSPTDALVVGLYAGRSQFSVESDNLLELEDFKVTSAALGVGYLKQLNEAWQGLAFVLPFYNDTDLANGSSYWQTMGGAFARYTHNPDLWWMFGAFGSTSSFESYLLPYVGVSWTISPDWTVSGILPWPQIIWSPSRDWLIGVGGMYSGSGWAISAATGEVAVDLNAFDLGIEYQRRLYGSLWGSLSVGVGGLRNLQFSTGGETDGPEFDVSSSPYIRFNFTMRPDDLM
jgi:hypothetical protein